MVDGQINLALRVVRETPFRWPVFVVTHRLEELWSATADDVLLRSAIDEAVAKAKEAAGEKDVLGVR